MFRSPVGEAPDRLCTACGRNPSLGIDTRPSPASSLPLTAPVSENQPSAGAPVKLPQRRRKESYFLLKLVAGWLLFLVAIVFAARLIWQTDEKKSNLLAVVTTTVRDNSAAQDEILLNQASPLFNQALGGFLSVSTPEERNQFVANPIATAAKMARFYSLNPPVKIEPKALSLDASAVVHLPKGKVIETQWQTSDDRSFDAVFIEEDGDWHLDWDHFARHGDYPWALFLAGSGEDHGEFRLLARERLAAERKGEDAISIVFYAPRAGYPNEVGSKSPEFLVPRNTANGRLLDAAFKQDRSGQRPFGVKLKSTDPEGLIRLRVKVRRVQEDQKRRFELDEVVACHWYSNDAKGVEVSENPAK